LNLLDGDAPHGQPRPSGVTEAMDTQIFAVLQLRRADEKLEPLCDPTSLDRLALSVGEHRAVEFVLALTAEASDHLPGVRAKRHAPLISGLRGNPLLVAPPSESSCVIAGESTVFKRTTLNILRLDNVGRAIRHCFPPAFVPVSRSGGRLHLRTGETSFPIPRRNVRNRPRTDVAGGRRRKGGGCSYDPIQGDVHSRTGCRGPPVVHVRYGPGRVPPVGVFGHRGSFLLRVIRRIAFAFVMQRREFLKGAGTAAVGGSLLGPSVLAPPVRAEPSTGQNASNLPIPEYDTHDATGLAALVRAGELTPGELLEAAGARMRARNEALNAVVFEWMDRAHDHSADGAAQGPFAGVPFLLKNLWTPLEGTPITNGSRLFEGHRSQTTGTIVERILDAGLVPFGRGNAPELGISATTEPLYHGPTHNPWDLSRTPGGSSGGAGAAVAGGIVPIAFASDGGGSARIPASCCGLVTMKPTRGRTPTSLGAALGQSLVVARSVRDVAQALDVMGGPVPGGPFRPESPETSYAEMDGPHDDGLRVAIATESPYGGQSLDPACTRAVKRTATLLEGLGHEVTETRPKYNFDRMAHAMFKVVMATGTANLVQERETSLGRRARSDELEPYTRAMVEYANHLTAQDYARGLQAIDDEARRFASIFADYDVYLTPTLGRPPLPLGELIGTIEDEDKYLDRLYGFMPFTMQYNASGRPAMSLPLFWSEDGLPIGLQLGAGHGQEALLFAVARQLEEAEPWFDRRSPMATSSEE